MKALTLIPVVFGAMVSCKDPDSAELNPKRGLHGASNLPGVGGQSLLAGQFVSTVIDNASFFNDLPMGEAMPDLLLPKYTSVRVITPGDGYCKVELDNGQVGYVQSAHMAAQQAAVPGGGTGRSLPVSGGTERIPTLIDPHLPPIVPGQ